MEAEATQGARPSGRAVQLGQQACGHNLGQGSCRPTSISLIWGGASSDPPVSEVAWVISLIWGGPRVIPQSQRLHGLPKVIQLALTIRIEARPPYLLSLTFGRGVGRGSGRSRLQGFLECAQWGTFEQS